MEFLIVQVGVVAPVGRPVQEPTEVAQLLLDGGVLQTHQIFLIIVLSFSLLFTRGPELFAVAHICDELRQGGLRQIGKLDVLLESGQIDTHRLHLLEGSLRPGVLLATLLQEHIIELEEVMFLGLALLLGLRSWLLRNGSVQPVLIFLLKLGRGGDLIDGLEELECGFHLVLNVPELVVDGQGCLALWALVTGLDKLSLIIPGFGIDELASGLQIQTLAVEGNPESDLIPVLVLSVSKETESCIALDFHFATPPLVKIVSQKYPKNAQR